ncbi:MAG: Cna B-type domain-containing protein, partial [Pygmaiobacter sp.]
VTFGTKESVASAANGWKYSFNDVESFDANGKSYNYVLNETGLSNSEYKMTLEQLINTVDIVNINVVNTLTGTVSVEIVKDWHDATDKDRPENVTMTLTRKTSVGADASFSEKFTLNTANSWGKTFDALAKYDAEGRLYEYAVSEDAVAGYEEDSSKGAVNIKDNKVTIHVANVRKDDTGRLVATKIWKDADNQQGLRPTSITINLIRTDSDNNETQISKTVTAADNWTAVFENVDLYDSDGKLYTNVFTEEAVPGYATDYLVKDEGLKVEITNTLSAKANVVATKTWLDAGDESMRPEALPLTLYRQTGTSEKTVVTTEPTITKTGSNWSYNYGELAQYDTEGRPYVYSVEETVPAGYTLDTARSSALHLYNVRTELTNVTATKAWQDSDNADGIRPQSVELSLERGIAPQAMTPLADTKVTVTAQANWQHTYENLPKFDENGNLYLYNVKEETLVPHYDEVAKAAPSTTATNQIRNKHLVTVRYVDLGTETKLMGDVVLGSFYEGQDYSAATQAAQPIQTYTNLGVRTTGAGSAPINGTMGTEDLLIVIEYSKVRTIPLTVKYMEVTLKDDGSFDRAAAIPMVGVNDVTTYFAEGESYDANRNPGLTYGYSFVKSEDASVAGSEVLDPTNLTGTMSPEKPLTFIHYFVRKLGENVIMHSYNHIHHPLTGNDVVNAEGQNSNPLNAGGTISIASLLVTVNGNYSYNPTSAEVLRLKNPQTNDELAALIATTIGDRVSEATKTEKADLDAK